MAKHKPTFSQATVCARTGLPCLLVRKKGPVLHVVTSHVKIKCWLEGYSGTTIILRNDKREVIHLTPVKMTTVSPIIATMGRYHTAKDRHLDYLETIKP